jgi:uncharacterized protein
MIFIDTGAFLARYIEADQYHTQAREVWARIKNTPLFTTNHIVDETLTLLARKTSHAFALGRAGNFYSSRELQIVFTTRADEEEALEYFKKFADQAPSFTDCISFAVMKRRSLKKVFSFDQHFAIAGFEVLPKL